MKRIYLICLTVSLIGVFAPPSFAECDCTPKEIIHSIIYASKSEKQSLFSELLKSSSFAPGYEITGNFASIIKASKYEHDFQEALKYYIVNNCKVKNENIICN